MANIPDFEVLSLAGSSTGVGSRLALVEKFLISTRRPRRELGLSPASMAVIGDAAQITPLRVSSGMRAGKHSG